MRQFFKTDVGRGDPGAPYLQRGDPLAFSLLPCHLAESIYWLTPQALRKAGIRLLLADLDNTLAPYEEALPSPALREWKEALEAEGIALYVVSNSRKSRRCPDFCEELGVPYVRHAGKPGTKGFREALERTGVQGKEALVVGDQIFTDILGGNRAGIPTLLVRPLAWGKNPLRRVRYALETPFRMAAMARHNRSS